MCVCVCVCVCVCMCVCVGGVLIRAGEGKGEILENIFLKKVDGDTYFTYSGLKSSSFYEKTMT